jgi:hypothetical protein
MPKREKWARAMWEEEDGRGVVLVGQDGGEADAGEVVDHDVEILITGLVRLPGPVAVDAVAGLHDTGQALDIEVDQVSRALALVAHHLERRIE